MVGMVEVLDGEIQARSPNSYRQNLIANNLYSLLEPSAAIGLLARGQVGYVLKHEREDIRTLRLPDVSYLRTVPEASMHSFVYGAPTLAVKVAADYETAPQHQRLIEDYLQAGSRQVWLVHPRDEEIYIYCAPQTVECYGSEDAFDVEEVFPVRVTVKVGDLFVYPWNKKT